MKQTLITYCRTTTGDEAIREQEVREQRAIISELLSGEGNRKLAGQSQMLNKEYIETEPRDKQKRPELQKALAACRLKNTRLIIGKLGKLSHELELLNCLQESGVRFTFADMPMANESTIHIFVALAQHERRLISLRIKEALTKAKAKGKRLGNPCLQRGERIPGGGIPAHINEQRIEKADSHARDMIKVIKKLPGSSQMSLREIANALNNAGYRTPRNGQWHATSVNRVLERAGRHPYSHVRPQDNSITKEQRFLSATREANEQRERDE